MTAIVKFFNSALVYFSEGFFGKTTTYYSDRVVNFSKTVVQGSKLYEDGKKRLDAAIREFDQAVLHLTARVIAGMLVTMAANQRYKI